MYRAFKITVKVLFTLFLIGLFIYPFMHGKAFMEESAVTGVMSYSSSYKFPDSSPDLSAFIPDFVQVPEGGTSWDLFAKTKSIDYEDKDEEGLEIVGVKPEFPEGLKKLDGQTVLMQGYMFPLESDEEQSLFLFGPFPVSCPFHYHVGPNLIIEAHGKKKIEYEWDAVNIMGRLELVPRDDEFNVFYRLHDAELAK